MTFISGCWQREDISMTSYILIDSYLISVSTSIRAWSWLFYPEHPICITGDWSEPQTDRRGPGLKLSWRQAAAMPYTFTKLSYETPCNFSTSRKKISDLSTAVNIVTSILHSQCSGIRIGLINVLWARGIGRTSGTAGWVLVVLSIVKPFYHGCSFVFSFVAERSRAGSAG